jgi:hypothetical protein
MPCSRRRHGTIARSGRSRTGRLTDRGSEPLWQKPTQNAARSRERSSIRLR